MEKTQEILFHLDELYLEKAKPEDVIARCEKNPERYAMWVSAFKDYDLSDVLQAIDQYWEYKNSKTRPNVAQIKAILNAHATEKLPEERKADTSVKGDEAVTRMQSDIANGNCRNNLYVYKDAVDIVLNDWLKEQLPMTVFARLSYGSRMKSATDKGLFANFDEALRQASQKRFGRDCEFESANDMQNLAVEQDLAKETQKLINTWKM